MNTEPSALPCGGPSSSVLATGNKRRSSRLTLHPPLDPHARHARARATVVAALSSPEATDAHARLAARLTQCRTGAFFATDGNGLPFLAYPSCRSRWCATCAARRSVRLAEQLESVLRDMAAPRTMVLTIAATDRPLTQQIQHILDSFRRLRQMARWEQCVRGGACILEITRNPATGRWHPHLHLLWTGTFFPHPALKSMWRTATGDSEIVWLSAVHDRRQDARYAAKYVAKAADLQAWPAAAILELIDALHGRRIVGTFGHLRGVRLLTEEAEPETPGGRRLCTVAAFRTALLRDDPDASVAACLLARLRPDWARAVGIDAPGPPAPTPSAGDWEMLATLLDRVYAAVDPHAAHELSPPGMPPDLPE